MTWDAIQCPSDTGADVPFSGHGGSWGRGNYMINAGPCFAKRGQAATSCEYSLLGSGVANVGWGSKLNVLASQDGTSNTILFTEGRIGLAAEDIRVTWALGWPAASLVYAGGTADAKTPNVKSDNSDDLEGCDQSKNRAGGGAELVKLGLGCCECEQKNNQATARSSHGVGVNAVFADGNVRLIRNSVNHRTWYKMLSRVDGEDYRYVEPNRR